MGVRFWAMPPLVTTLVYLCVLPADVAAGRVAEHQATIQTRTDVPAAPSSTTRCGDKSRTRRPQLQAPFLLATGVFSDDVVRFDLATGSSDEVIRLGENDWPRGIAVDSDRFIYVALNGGSLNVKRFTWDGVFVDDVTGPIGMWGPGQLLAYGENQIIVAGDSTDLVFRYDRSSGELIDSFGLPGHDALLGLASAGKDLYVAAYASSSIAHFDLSQSPVVGVTLVPNGGSLDHPIGLTVGHNGNLFVANRSSGLIQEFDVVSGDFLGTFIDVAQVGASEAWDVHYSGVNDRYYVSVYMDTVYEFDASGQLTGSYQSDALQNSYSITVVPLVIRVPEDAPTIQAAVDMAPGGAVVSVAPGVYAGSGNRNIDFHGKDIWLRSVDGAASTVIDVEFNGRGFHFHSAESSAATVEGFTMTSGFEMEGAGVLVDGAAPTFRDCVFKDIEASNTGGGVLATNGASPSFEQCTFIRNVAGLGGAVAANEGSNITLENCTLYGNAADAGGGIALLTGGSAIAEAVIIAFGGRGEAVFCADAGVTMTCCDLYGNAGGDWVGCVANQAGTSGNFSEDPLFCNPTIGTLTLHEDSPCAPDLSPPSCGLIGALAVGCGTTAVTRPPLLPVYRRLSVQPNPVLVRASFRIYGFGAGARLEIYDALGRLVKALAPTGSVTWTPAATAPSGVYFARATGEGVSEVVKFMVLR